MKPPGPLLVARVVLLALVPVAAACGASHGTGDRAAPSAPAASPADTAEPAGADAPVTGAAQGAATLDPAPPAGFIMPAIGRVRSVRAGTSREPFVWMAIFEADPNDRRVAALVAADKPTQYRPDTIDAGDAASMLYQEQVRAAGVQVTAMEGSFEYSIQSGALDVLVRPGDQFHRGDPNGFSIFVGRPGG